VTIFGSSNGDDLPHHVYRIILLNTQINAGNFSPMLTNPLTGETLPTFFYYSHIPYVLPVILTHLGLGALTSYKLTLSIYWVVLVTGMWKLATAAQDVPGRSTGAFYACIFLASNYVFCLWVTGSALSMCLAYSLVPWIIIALAENKRDSLKILSLLTLQIAAHPILVLNCMAINLTGAWAISNTTVLETLRRNLLYVGAAIIFSAPFWAFQFWWRGAILGLDGLPVTPSKNFSPLLWLFHPFNYASIGLWMFVAVFLLSLNLPKDIHIKSPPYVNFSSRPALLLLAFLVSIALQTTYLRGITILIPLMDLQQFPWRLMFVSAVLALLFLCSCGLRSPSFSLKGIAALATINMFAICVYRSCPSLPQAFFPSPDQEPAYMANYARTSVWGQAEYFPNYAGIRQHCPDDGGRQDLNVSYESLREGVTLPSSGGDLHVNVEHAPIGFVTYKFSSLSVPPVSRCGESLVFGPFHVGGVLRADETTLTRLMIARLFVMVLIVAGLGVVLCRAVRKAPHPASSGSLV